MLSKYWMNISTLTASYNLQVGITCGRCSREISEENNEAQIYYYLQNSFLPFHQGHLSLRQYFKSVLEKHFPFFLQFRKSVAFENIDLVYLDKNGLPLLAPQKFKDCTFKKKGWHHHIPQKRYINTILTWSQLFFIHVSNFICLWKTMTRAE